VPATGTRSWTLNTGREASPVRYALRHAPDVDGLFGIVAYYYACAAKRSLRAFGTSKHAL